MGTAVFVRLRSIACALNFGGISAKPNVKTIWRCRTSEQLFCSENIAAPAPALVTGRPGKQHWRFLLLLRSRINSPKVLSPKYSPVISHTGFPQEKLTKLTTTVNLEAKLMKIIVTFWNSGRRRYVSKALSNFALGE